MRPAPRSAPSSLALSLALTIGFAVEAGAPVELHAQFGNLKKKAVQTVFCAGGVVGGLKIGAKIADMEMVRRNVPAADQQKYRLAFQIGTALILCKGGAAIAGSVYDKLSERDLEARQREMDAALADAEPGTRTYVMPESQIEGTLTTEPIVAEGNQECRVIVDQLADVEGGEPVMTKFCRKPPDGKWEVDAGL